MSDAIKHNQQNRTLFLFMAKITTSAMVREATLPAKKLSVFSASPNNFHSKWTSQPQTQGLDY